MIRPTVLLVDDDAVLREVIVAVLEQDGFVVTEACDVNEAMLQIASNRFDVLVSDLHMPGAGDGLTVISAMRHKNPKTVTILLSAFPQMDVAVKTIVAQTDQILVKSKGVENLPATIHARLAQELVQVKPTQSVAMILERSIKQTVEAWYARVQQDEGLMNIPLSREARVGFIVHILNDLVSRLRSTRAMGDKSILSIGAFRHGILRREQGYSAAMMVDESRALQVSIFETLNDNTEYIDFSLLLQSVMLIADEVDSQLSQAMESYRLNAAASALTA